MAKLQDVKPAVSSLLRSFKVTDRLRFIDKPNVDSGAPNVSCFRFKYSEAEIRLASPEQLQTKPDVDSLEFGKYFTDHMIKINYHNALDGWQKPSILPVENISLHPAAKVLHYAIEVGHPLRGPRE